MEKTKRNELSELASVYDPKGLIYPTHLRQKVLTVRYETLNFHGMKSFHCLSSKNGENENLT